MDYRKPVWTGLLIGPLLTGMVAAQGLSAATASTSFKDIVTLYEDGDYNQILDEKDKWVAVAAYLPDSSAAEVYGYIGNSFFLTGIGDSALMFFDREYPIREKHKDTQYVSYSNVMYNLMLAHNALGNYSEAMSTGKRLIEGDREHFGTSSEEYVSSVTSYLEVLTQQGEFVEAKALAIATEAAIGKVHPLHPELSAHLADILALLGEYSKAELQFNKALDEFSLREESDMASAALKVNLANMLLDRGRLIEAEQIYADALEIFKSMGDDGAENYYSCLNNFGLAELGLKRTDDAIRTFDELIRHDRELYGEDHPYFAIAINNAGSAFSNTGDLNRAVSYLEQYRQLAIKIYGEDSYYYAAALNNLGKALARSGQPGTAIPLFEQALPIFQKSVGENSVEVLTTTFNLGSAQMMLKSPQAKTTLIKALNGRKALLDVNHPQYGETTFKLAIHDWMTNNPTGAISFFKETFSNYYNQIDRYFSGLSEAEKTQFYYNGLRPALEIFNTFAIQHHQQHPELLEMVYDIQLNTKALVFYATNKVKEGIVRSKDSVLLAKYDTWLSNKEQLAKHYNSTSASGKIIDSLEHLTNAEEKELNRLSVSFRKNFSRDRLTWKNVQSRLGKGQVAIEMIRFREYTPDSGGYYTGRVRYAALLLKKENKKGPQLVAFNNEGNRMEKHNMSYYRNAIKFQVDDPYSYEVFWEPIAREVKGATKIYFSPDGTYHQINLNSIHNPTTGKYLIDEVLIEDVTNTKDIVEFNRTRTVGHRTSFLMGFPKYALDNDATPTKQTNTLGKTQRGGILRYLRGESGIVRLPETKTEIEKINSILADGKMKAEVLLDDRAQEAKIKALEQVSMLHIATHGFFDEDPDFLSATNTAYIENPLLRAGLVLSGAEDFLTRGYVSADNGEDGILLAIEVMNLNLDDADLVILSACETGLGEIKNGEGVYGLRRAFWTAGAKCLVMSLWKVDDRATQELMVSFYQNLLKTGNKQEAFRQAQQSLRKSYPDPFYWAPFVMIGE